MSKRVLFVCIKNSSRSQMAEALVKMRGATGLEVCSAGIEPGAGVNPMALEAMDELGYDLRPHRSKHISVFLKTKFDKVVKMDTPDLGDMVHARWMENWDIPDPAQGGIEEFRKVRDLLAARVDEMLREYAPCPSQESSSTSTAPSSTATTRTRTPSSKRSGNAASRSRSTRYAG